MTGLRSTAIGLSVCLHAIILVSVVRFPPSERSPRPDAYVSVSLTELPPLAKSASSSPVHELALAQPVLVRSSRPDVPVVSASPVPTAVPNDVPASSLVSSDPKKEVAAQEPTATPATMLAPAEHARPTGLTEDTLPGDAETGQARELSANAAPETEIVSAADPVPAANVPEAAAAVATVPLVPNLQTDTSPGSWAVTGGLVKEVVPDSPSETRSATAILPESVGRAEMTPETLPEDTGAVRNSPLELHANQPRKASAVVIAEPGLAARAPDAVAPLKPEQFVQPGTAENRRGTNPGSAELPPSPAQETVEVPAPTMPEEVPGSTAATGTAEIPEVGDDGVFTVVTAEEPTAAGTAHDRPPSEVAGPPMSVAGQAQIRRYVDAYEGGDCFSVSTVSVSDAATDIDGFAHANDPLLAFNRNFVATFGFEPVVIGQKVWSPQCPAVNFLHRLRATGERLPKLTTASTLVRRGEIVRGTIRPDAQEQVSLFMVSHDGQVEDLSRHLVVEGELIRFAFPVELNTAGGPYPEMLVAIVSSPALSASPLPETAAAGPFFETLMHSTGRKPVAAAAKLILVEN